MTSDNAYRRAGQLRSLAVIETLIRDHDLPTMVWTIGPYGIAGDPYGATTDADRRAAIESWARLLGATWWAPHVADGMTTLRASVKDFQGASIILRAVLFDSDVTDR